MESTVPVIPSSAPLEIEVLSPNDIITCLWHKHAVEKCRIGLSDIVVFENAVPVRWYVTGKTGEIVKKRGVDMSIISDRWLRIASSSQSQVIAILRQTGGVYKFLGIDSLKAFIASKVKDYSILSLHCFVKGSNQIIFRNSFILKDKLNRFASTTSSYAYNTSQFNTDNEAFNVSVMQEDTNSFTEIKASSLKKIMDLATNTVIRYVENMLQIRILNISIDYIIDTKSQLWMLWTSEAHFVRTINIATANIPNFSSGTGVVGRMGWAGNQYLENIRDPSNTYDSGNTSSPVSSPNRRTRSPTHSYTNSNDTAISNDSNTRKLPLFALDIEKTYSKHGPGDVAIETVSKQVDSAEGTIGDIIVNRKNKRSSINNMISKRDTDAVSYTISETNDSSSHPNISVYPDPFKCKGDYCKARIINTGNLSTSTSNKVHTPEHFFSDKEIAALKKDKKFAQMMEFGSNGPALAVISYKSIVLARNEMRGIEEETIRNNPLTLADDDTSGNSNKYHAKVNNFEYPLTPRSMAGGTIDLSRVCKGDKSTEDMYKEERRRQKVDEGKLKNNRDHIDAFTKHVAGYYDQVRVCGVCNNVYTVLDWARSLLGHGDAHSAWKEAEEAKATGTHQKHKRGNNQSLKENSLNNLSVLTDNQEYSVDIGTASIDTFDNTASSPESKSNGNKHGNNSKVKRTWKDYHVDESKLTVKNKKKERQQFADLDDYLRAGADTLAHRKSKEREEYVKKRMSQIRAADGSTTFEVDGDLTSVRDAPSNTYRGTVLLAFAPDHADISYALEAKATLEEAFFDVTWSKDGRQAINDFLARDSGYDCVLTQRDLPFKDCFDITTFVRDFEKNERKKAAAYAASEGKGIQPVTKRHPVICYTNKTTPDDLKLYMKNDLDGCVSYPLNKASLLNTVRAAIPYHLAPVKKPDTPPPPEGARVYKLGSLGELEGATDSATMAAKTLPISTKNNEDEYAFNGVIQIDADTRLPYIVMDASRTAKVNVNPQKPFFNLIVCHDLFDTAERMKIFLRPLVQKYLGMQVLLWNMAGQAFTEWREEQLLNNEYHSSCLNEVLGQLGEKGTKDFDTTRPFYVLGYGNGSHVSQFYASHYRVPNLRGVISVNGWSYIDSFLAGSMHDCINIFQSTPPARPDLPVYFYSRFLFSKDYLAKVSVPLALNLYTAVYNPISLSGRINLCRGVLKSVDVRSLLKEIDCPMICIHSTQNSLSRPLHTESFVTHRAGEVRSIHKVLQEPSKTCIIWMKGGHEVFQENKKQVQLLLEQILTGFHDMHDISFPPASVVDKTAADNGQYVSNLPYDKNPKLKTVEDKYVDSVLTSINQLSTSSSTGSINRISTSNSGNANNGNGNSNTNSRSRSNSPNGRINNSSSSRSSSIVFSSSDPNAWNEYSQSIAESMVSGTTRKGKDRKKDMTTSASTSAYSASSLDPNSSSFAKQDSFYNRSSSSSSVASNVHDYPEVKEYMGWRLKRNKKRLQRLQAAARTLQGAFRAYMARVLIRGIRRRKAASTIQRAYRGWLGRCTFLSQARRIWGSQVIQRCWRGYLGRKFYWVMRLRLASAANIQRVFRGYRTRIFVNEVRRVRYKAASLIQSLYRRNAARREAFRRRYMRNCSVTVQRVYRGRLGRRRAFAERDKYIFSRSQSHGIEFGRQMLLEHKLHATKLQSDVTLLTQEKVSVEEQVEALLEEISSFEEGVRTLEKEMHQLSKVESQAAAYMDEESKYELREQKIKLDREFGEMLGKIGNRKDLLDDLETKLSTVDKARQIKEEELRTLERKLVVLLEEQQNELNAIKRKQDVRGAMLAASHTELLKAASGAPGSQTALVQRDSSGSSVSGGPSIQERRQAAQLMQSTETLMKFGFMSMSMTYFSSLNMIKALRTVSAQDTVMAALADVQSQRAVNHGTQSGGSADGSGGPTPAGLTLPHGSGTYHPHLKGNQLGGQEALKVSSWSVDDVSKWLQTLSLGQYSETFRDGAIDGEFLYDVNDDDLKNTLGIEHRLHRKKILNCVHRLKLAEAQQDERLNQLLRAGGNMEQPSLLPDDKATLAFPDNPFKPNADATSGGSNSSSDGPKVPLSELISLTRHSKLPLLREALDYLPNKKFDKTLVKVPYITDFGTVYVEGYDRLLFHINKSDEFGNSMLSLACQNGNAKICKYLVAKGANPNHQNKMGQTPAHFAIAYKFFDLSQWLFENGGNDSLENKFGLTCYDGLAADDDDATGGD